MVESLIIIPAPEVYDMFDRIVMHAPQRTEYVDRNITITEKRAPTDQSVKLLSEMETAAEDRLVCRGEIRNNTMSVQWNVFQDIASAMMDYKVVVRIKLNGTEHLLKFNIDYKYGKDQEAVVVAVRDKIAELIATQIMIDAFHDKAVSDMTRRLAM